MRKQFSIILICAAILVYPAILSFTSNINSIETAQSLCPSKLLTGLPCPGCGITKSILFLYAGDFIKSIQQHFFGPLVVIICGIGLFMKLTEILTGKILYKPSSLIRFSGYAFAFSLGLYHLGRLTLFLAENSISEIMRQSIWR